MSLLPTLASTPTTSLPLIPCKPIIPTTPISSSPSPSIAVAGPTGRRELLLAICFAAGGTMMPAAAVRAATDEEYAKETAEVIGMVRATVGMDRSDPNVAAAVAELREASNAWVAKYRREKALLGRASFRDMYSALNAVSGHYISFGPTAPIPAKRKARILEEMETAEKALLRGR